QSLRAGPLPGPQAPEPPGGIHRNDVAGQPVDVATDRLRAANVDVEAVEPFDPIRGVRNAVDFVAAPDTLPAGARVRLFAANGVVRYYQTLDRKSTRLNSSHRTISYAVFCLKKKSN